MLLRELTRACLLIEPQPGRFICHDLLRAYAAELGNGHDAEADRRSALHRLLGHYLHTALGAALWLTPPGDRSNRMRRKRSPTARRR